MRFYEDPFGEFSSTFIAIDDLDQHTRVQNFALIERKTPADVLGWVRVILRRWTNAAKFVMPVMWDNTELTYHLPLGTGWRMKLKFV